MGLQGLNGRNVRRIERVTGLRIVRGVVNNGHEWRTWHFTTADHRHGWVDRTTGEWSFDEQPVHTTLCDELFGQTSTLGTL